MMPKTSLDLTGKWEFKQYPLSSRRMRDLDSDDWLSTEIPCSVFDSLISADQIKQGDINTNPEKFSWVSEKPWIYRKNFDVTSEILDCDQIDLVFDGLDTITSIWFNNKLIGKTSNMFIPFRFDVTSLLKQKNNSLLIKFESSIQYAKKMMNRYTSFSESEFINPHRVYLRKAQYQFGWDFCPPLPGCGIWRPVRLEGIKKAKIDYFHIRTVDCNHKYADIKIAVKLNTTTKTKEKLSCKLTLSCAEQEIVHNLTFKSDENSQSTVIRIVNPLLWWPTGYGEQHLYQLTLELINGNEIIDQAQRKIGIRTVKLNRSTDRNNEKFQFEINGQPVFAKGANWIPASVFAGSVTDEDYEKLLHAAVQSNMNLLRVWGGGYYEADKFYELCDQLGIMVWQDFMFACGYYPDRDWFSEEVKKEAAIIIRRLRNFSCLVLWCGNNEIDWMHNTGKFGKGKKFYGKIIYHQILPQLVAVLDPDTAYIPTTPLQIADNVEQITGRKRKPDAKDHKSYATEHQWDVWSGHQPIRQYICPAENIPPFVTEFGLQSLPCMETIENFCHPKQMHIGSFSIEKHNYQLDGNSRLYRYIGDLFGATENPEQFVYLSQITQARAVKVYVEHLRAHNSRNSGVLFWQFNDCCPAISWSAIDYTKRPKALFYYAKRFFSNQLIVVLPELSGAKAGLSPAAQQLCVIVINDSNQPLTASLHCRLIDLFGRLIDQVAFPIVISPFSTSPLLKLPKAIVSPEHPDKSVLHLLIDKNGKKTAENLFLFAPDKHIEWPLCQITHHLTHLENNSWKLSLKTNVVTKDVQITTQNPARLSDNFIDLLPESDHELTIDFDTSQPHPEKGGINLRTIKSAIRLY